MRRPGRTPSPERELPTPVEPEAGKASYACRMDVMARTKKDLRKEEYGASLSVLFCASRQMTAVVQSVAVEKGLPWRTVPEVTVMLGDGRRETSTKLFFIEIKAYRTHQSSKELNPILIAAYGVQDLAPFAAAVPELPLLRHRFPDARPAIAMGMLAQKEGPIDLLIARDYRKQWPVAISSTCFDSDRLYLMKTTFYPGQLLYGLADPDAVGTKMKGVKRRLTLGKGESAGSLTSSSRRPRAATPAADSPERRRRESPSPIRRVREKSEESPSPTRRVRERSRGPPSRSTSAASSTERRQRDRNVSSRRDREDRSVKRKEKESPAREAPAKERRTRVLSSSSSSSSGNDVVVTIDSSDDSFLSSSSEDEAIAEVRIVDEEEERQLRMLGEQREKHKERYKALQKAVRVHGAENLVQRAKAYSATQRAAREESETAKAQQQEKRAVVELSGADRAAAERGERGRSARSSVRRRTEEGERVGPAPPAAGGTSAAAAGNTRREQQKSRPAPPAVGGTSEVAAAARPEQGSRPDRSAPPAAGGTSAAAADKSERPCGKGKLTPPAAGGTSAVAVSKPEQVSRPAKPALLAAGETSAAAAGAAKRLSEVTGSRPGYRIPRLVSPIREGYFENFQALPEVLDSCIIRAPETVQDKFFFSVLMEAGIVLFGREARDYGGAHFRLQRKPERRSYSD